MKKILFSLLALTALCSPAHAFDCAKAGTESEKAICASPELLKLDAELNASYSVLSEAVKKDDQAPLKASQVEWLKSRDKSCKGDGECLKGEMQERLKALMIWNVLPVVVKQEAHYAILKIKDKDMEVNYPQLVDLPAVASLDSINNRMAEEARDAGCMDGTSTQTAEVTLLNDRLFSYKGNSYSDCGGAHYSTTDYGVSYDLKTGKEITLKDIGGKEKLQKLAASAMRKHPPELKCADIFGDDYSKVEVFDFYFNKDSELVIIPDAPHVVNECQQDVNLGKAAYRLP